MSKLLENIMKYYISEIMKSQNVDEITATLMLEDTLQSENIDNEILDYAESLDKESYL